MADSKFEVLSIKFIFDPEITHCEVVCGPPSDGMLGVQGMHRKSFPPSVSAIDILRNEMAGAAYLLW